MFRNCFLKSQIETLELKLPRCLTAVMFHALARQTPVVTVSSEWRRLCILPQVRHSAGDSLTVSMFRFGRYILLLAALSACSPSAEVAASKSSASNEFNSNGSNQHQLCCWHSIWDLPMEIQRRISADRGLCFVGKYHELLDNNRHSSLPSWLYAHF